MIDASFVDATKIEAQSAIVDKEEKKTIKN
jgi:hypothetical protein